MSLYIRVVNGFYTHRKTIRLLSAIGEAAYWVPPRLWAYASENQPDGCLEQYSAEELAMLIGYKDDAKVLLQALLLTGFLDPDPLRIHDWEEHNGHHVIFAERAKKAAAARWAKLRKPTGPDKTRQDSTVQEGSIASSIPQASKFEGFAPQMIDELHQIWQERTGLEAKRAVYERDWYEFIRLGWRKPELELVIEHTKVLNKDRDEQYRAPLALGRLIGDRTKFADRLQEAQAWEKAGRSQEPKKAGSNGAMAYGDPRNWKNWTQAELNRWVASSIAPS